MPLLKDDHYTIEDIYALPEGKRAELIDGQIYDMAPPSYQHQRLVMELSSIEELHQIKGRSLRGSTCSVCSFLESG